MATLIENQNIAKRHKTSRSRHTNNSAGYNNEFMSLFDQKPSTKKKKKSSKRQTYSFPERDPRKNTRREKPFTPSKIRTNNNGGSGFTFRVPTLATLLVIAGVVITGLAVFSWEDVNLKVPEIYSFPVSESEKTDRRIAVYAENGITDILPANPGLQSSISEDDLAETEANNNHHGALITFEWHEHKVQRGETLSEIAQKFNISYGTIVAINNIKNARRVPAGTLLRIPTIDGLLYEVKSGDSLSKISVMQNIPLNAILDVNDIRSDNIKEGEKIFLPGARMNDIDLRMSLGDLFMYPLQNKYITSHFGMRKDPKTGVLQFHGGVDFRGSVGTTIMASMDGSVSVVSQNRLYGKYIIITHGNGYKTLYGHLNSFNVKEGDKVIRGRKIGEVGNTGYSTGPHLHFGIYDKNNRAVNPLELLN